MDLSLRPLVKSGDGQTAACQIFVFFETNSTFSFEQHFGRKHLKLTCFGLKNEQQE
jgi:hypothetical protein